MTRQILQRNSSRNKYWLYTQ